MIVLKGVIIVQRQYVSSSRISSVGWENDTLEVQFKNGSVYQYYNVSRIEFNQFINSSSLGHQLSIIDKTHPYKKIS